jgi:amino acid adenylation domain-containing protein
VIPFLLHHHLERWAAATPDAVAVEDRGVAWTYRAVDARANRMAHLLAESGVEPGDRVGLWLGRSADMIAAGHGASKAGAIAVPLDDRAPTARVSTIASDCGIRAIVTVADRADVGKHLAGAGNDLRSLVALGDDTDTTADAGLVVFGERSLAGMPDTAPPGRGTERDAALILYTSGSTGTPKGVVLSHRCAGTLGEFCVDWFGLRQDDRLAHIAPAHYIAAVGEIQTALVAGATLVIPASDVMVFPAELPRFLVDARIAFFGGVPSMLAMLVERGNVSAADLPALRGITFAGERMAPRLVRRLSEAFPGVRLGHGYGSTETGVCLIAHMPQPVPAEFARLPGSRPAPNMDVFVVTEDGRRAGPGESGEIHARGRGVMTGYWGRPEETRRVLGPHPLDPDCAEPVFRTGDIGVIEDDGSITVVGRRDHQVKTRGVRVELAEVEAAVAAHPDVAECAVVAIDDELFTTLLIAHVVARAEVTPRQLATWCRRRLAPAMVPARFEIHDGLPKTASGKVDRAALGDARSS